MSVVEEAPVHAPDVDEVDEFVCHLYAQESRWSLCGLHDSKDQHTQMHWDHKSPHDIGFRVSEGPGDGCPTCGAPICPKCKELVGKMDELRRMAMDALRRSF